MSVLSRLASTLDRNDEVPNQELARALAAAGDKAGVRELVDALAHPDKAIQSDCIKVLYEIGALKPDLIAPYAETFIRLLRSRNNRLVWGAMTALGAIADRTAAAIWKDIDVILTATEKGSAITQDWGVRVLAIVSAQDGQYEARIFPFLTRFLSECPPKDVPRHAESALVAVKRGNRAAILHVLEARRSELKAAQLKRLDHVIRKVKAL
jgi:HEAT repeat protein